MKNEHLIPANIVDIVDKLKATSNENEKNNYILRLEVIRDYCDSSIKKYTSMSVPVRKKNILR